MNNDLTFILQLKDLLSPAMNRAQTQTQQVFSQMNQAMVRTQQQMRNTGTSIKDINARLNELTENRVVSVDSRHIRQRNREMQELEQRRNRLETMGRRSEGGGIGGMIGGLASRFGPTAMLAAAGMLGTSSISQAMDFQAQSKSFEVLAGDAKRGRELVNELRDLKQSTIMGATVYKNAQTMMAFGIDNKEVVRDLKMIGDIAMGDQQRMESLTLAFSQVRAGGKLMGQDLLQFINAGFNPLQVMSDKWKEFGLKQKMSVGQLKEAMEKGKISSDAVTNAFIVATKEGGKFHDMMNKIGDTSAGQMQKLKGNWAAFQIDLGNALMPIASSFMTIANDTLHFLNISKTAPEVLMAEKNSVDYLIGSITKLNEGNDLRRAMQETLVAKYPELFGKIDIEKTKNTELLAILNDVNSAYDKRIQNATIDYKLQRNNEEIAKLKSEAVKIGAGDQTIIEQALWFYRNKHNRAMAPEKQVFGAEGRWDRIRKLQSDNQSLMAEKQLNIRRDEADDLASRRLNLCSVLMRYLPTQWSSVNCGGLTPEIMKLRFVGKLKCTITFKRIKDYPLSIHTAFLNPGWDKCRYLLMCFVH